MSLTSSGFSSGGVWPTPGEQLSSLWIKRSFTQLSLSWSFRRSWFRTAAPPFGVSAKSKESFARATGDGSLGGAEKDVCKVDTISARTCRDRGASFVLVLAAVSATGGTCEIHAVDLQL
jgi:hypothetical protein